MKIVYGDNKLGRVRSYKLDERITIRVEETLLSLQDSAIDHEGYITNKMLYNFWKTYREPIDMRILYEALMTVESHAKHPDVQYAAHEIRRFIDINSFDNFRDNVQVDLVYSEKYEKMLNGEDND